MSFSAKEYLELKSEQLPYTTQWGFTIDDIDGECSICNSKLSNLKVLINEYKNFCVIRSVGVCENCNVVISCRPAKISSKNEFYCLANNMWLPLRLRFMKVLWKQIKNFFTNRGS